MQINSDRHQNHILVSDNVPQPNGGDSKKVLSVLLGTNVQPEFSLSYQRTNCGEDLPWIVKSMALPVHFAIGTHRPLFQCSPI